MVITNMLMIIKCIVLNEMVMFVVVSYMVCNLFLIMETVVFEYIGVFMCGITVVINNDVIIDSSVVGV